MGDNARFKNVLGKTQLQISQLGFGSAPLGSLRDTISTQDAETLIDSAFAMDIRYFDTAPLYGEGRSERHVGNALKKFNRNDYLLSTKVGRLLRASNTSNNLDVVYDYNYQGAISSLEESLERLQLEYVDILLCHDIDVWTHKSKQPQIFDQATQGILPALLDLREKGRIGAFGIGVNEWQVCERVIELFDIDCILLAGRFTLLEQEALDSLLPKCAEKKISIIIGGPYNSGLLATTEKNIADAASEAGVAITLNTYEDFDMVTNNFIAGACDIITTDGSALVGRKAKQQPADQEWVIFPATPISKEPLGPTYGQNDSAFADVVNWAVYATVIADEKGVTAANASEMKLMGDTETIRLLGGEGELQTAMGLSADAFYQVITQVGNYDEIYTRNLGPVGLSRVGSSNASWTNGGLVYAPPAR